MQPIERSLYSFLEEYANNNPQGILFQNEEEKYTSKEIYDIVKHLAFFWSEQNIHEQSVIAFSGIRSIDATILLISLQAIGALVVLCDSHNTTKKIIGDTIPELECDFFIDCINGEWYLNSTAIPLLTIKDYPMQEINEIDIKKPTIMVFTSGTTGKNKGVLLSQYNYINHMYQFGTIAGVHAEKEASLQILPIYHVFGLMQVVYSIFYQCRLFYPETIDVDYICRIIDENQITRLASVPTLALALAKQKLEKGYLLHTLKVACLGGAPLSEEHYNYIEDILKLKIVPTYGMSECVGIAGAGPEIASELKSNSVGKPLPLNKVVITDEGEIAIKGPSVFYGYYGSPKNDENAFFKTGDLGFFDDLGFLHITGRIKDIIIRNGNNISTAVIEKKLASLSFVDQCVVVAVADEEKGELPLAFIVMKKNMTFSETEVKNVLTKIEYPKEIKFVDYIPVNRIGKPDKEKLKEMYL